MGLWLADLRQGCAARRIARHSAADTGAVADGARRDRCGGSTRGSRGSRFQLLILCLYPTRHRAAVQQIPAADRRGVARARRTPARALRFRGQGTVRHGRLEPLEPRQRLFHRLRRGAAHRLLRHACCRGFSPTKSRRCSRTNSATSSCGTCSSAPRGSRPGACALLALLGWLVDQPWFYAGLGVPVRAAALRRRAGAVHARAAGVHFPRRAARIGRTRGGTNSRPTPTPRSTRRHRRWLPRWSSSTRTTPTR